MVAIVLRHRGDVIGGALGETGEGASDGVGSIVVDDDELPATGRQEPPLAVVARAVSTPIVTLPATASCCGRPRFPRGLTAEAEGELGVVGEGWNRPRR